MLYAIKLSSEKYAKFNQYDETDVDVISTELQNAELFDTKENAERHAKDINFGVNEIFAFYTEYKAVAVVEVMIQEGKVFELED